MRRKQIQWHRHVKQRESEDDIGKVSEMPVEEVWPIGVDQSINVVIQ